ncbi:MAG: hypothetical protein KGJ80_07780 [Chloroflexota bacterium]|nr:hypothetical protein [Chloroflexota bacterium]
MSSIDLVPILKEHRPFAVVSSFGLALLYAEEAGASYKFWSHRPLNEAVLLIAAITLTALIGYLISFFFPPRLIKTWVHPRPWGVFINLTAWSAGIVAATNVILFALLLYLVQFDFTASYNLLRDVYVYTLFAMVFFHGFLLYVRYMHYLYQIPDYVQPMKVIAASVGMGIVLFVGGGFLFLLDLYNFGNAPAAVQPILGLHIYARALYALTLALAAYAWHLRWIGDH